MTQTLPLAGLRVLEMAHTVMGPTCGVVLADLGADVIRVEPAPAATTRAAWAALPADSSLISIATSAAWRST